MIDRKSKIFIAGHRGMVGSAVERVLRKNGFENIVTRSKNELNLIDQRQVEDFFSSSSFDYVIIAAARVGGIQANISRPAEFLYENLMIQNNIIHNSYKSGVKKVVFFGSSCIYPKECPQPMKEEYLLTGKLEPTNEGYAIAKITGIKLLEAYHKNYGLNSISLMPCNLYGTNDSFHPEHAHVLSSLVRKFVDAVDNHTNGVEIWGTGVARREFMHVDDMADATLYFLENYNSPNFVNVGWGTDVSIRELADMIAKESGYEGDIIWDTTKPNGMMRKCMDVTLMEEIGFKPSIQLEQGIRQTILEYKKQKV